MCQCSICQEDPNIYCRVCSKNFCLKCSQTVHLPQDKIKHDRVFLCDDCWNEEAIIYCINCDQNMCSTCNKKFHNKGKRAKHSREPVESVDQRQVFAHFILLYSDIYQILSENNVVSMLEQIKKQQNLETTQTILHYITKKQSEKDQDENEHTYISTKIKKMFEYFNSH